MGLLSRVVLLFSVILHFLEGVKLCFTVGGVIAPVFTPVDIYGRVNLDAILPYVQFLVDHNVNGVLVAGVAGEATTLNVTDKKNMIDAWMDAAQPRQLSVIIQVGGIPLPDALELAAYAEAARVDAILTLPDVYNKPNNPRELVYFVQEVAQAAPETPILYYHTPEYTGVDVDMVEFLRLATERIPTFRGFKSTDFRTALILQDKLTEDQKMFIADPLYLAPALFMGFKDFIIAETNLFPNLVRYIVYYGVRYNYRRARPQYRRMRRLTEIITEYHEGNELAALKKTMPVVTGINVGSIRPPRRPITYEEIIYIEDRLKAEHIEIVDSAYDDEDVYC